MKRISALPFMFDANTNTIFMFRLVFVFPRNVIWAMAIRLDVSLLFRHDFVSAERGRNTE